MGIGAATTANFGFCRPENPLSAESFMLHPFKKKLAEPVHLTGEYLMAAFKNFPKSKKS